MTILNIIKNVGLVLLFALIFTWGAVSHANNQLWADQKTYALYWLQQEPGLKIVYSYLGDAYRMEGSLKEAKKYYSLALSGGHESSLEAYTNLGVIDQAEGNYKGAEFNYKMALTIDPNWSIAYATLGSLYLKEGQFNKAKENFDRALILDPLLIEARGALALILLKHSEYQKAINLCLKNLDIANDDQ